MTAREAASGISVPKPLARPEVVEFSGPFSWLGTEFAPAVSGADIAKKCGVYLWTVATPHGELVYYVGETGRSFEVRMTEHLREHLSGGYHLYDPGDFERGRKTQLWPGRFGKTRGNWPDEFVRRYEALAPAVVGLVKVFRFYLAPLVCERRLRERIEAAIAGHLDRQPDMAGDFQDTGIRYQGRRDDEEPVEFRVCAPPTIVGVPETLIV